MKIKGVVYPEYEEYKNSITMAQVLEDAGFVLNKRDGLRFPAYIKVDSDGRKIPGEKFIITANGKGCFKPPQMKVWNIIGFIGDHPEMFPEYQRYGNDKAKLINEVCCRLSNKEPTETETYVREYKRSERAFDISPYQIHKMDRNDFDTIKPFYPFFITRGINVRTQKAFAEDIILATKEGKQEGKYYVNLSFPLRIPNGDGKIVGFEERGRPRLDGSSGYKGIAFGSNASEGLWMSSPGGTNLLNAKKVFVFESAYDAMAFYQILTGADSSLDSQSKKELESAVYVSTAGNPSMGQMRGLLRNSQADFHLCFDEDEAGKQFVLNFQKEAKKQEETDGKKITIVREVPDNGCKDWNENLLLRLREDEEEYTEKKIQVGIDIDGDGEVEIEEAEEKEETHHRSRKM